MEDSAALCLVLSALHPIPVEIQRFARRFLGTGRTAGSLLTFTYWVTKAPLLHTDKLSFDEIIRASSRSLVVEMASLQPMILPKLSRQLHDMP